MQEVQVLDDDRKDRRDILFNIDMIWHRDRLFFLVYLSLVSSFSFVQMQSLSLKKEEKGRLRRTRNYKVSEGSEDSYDARAKDLMNKENKHW